MIDMTEDQVRDMASKILRFENSKNVKSGVGQLTTFNQLGFKGIMNKPDGWYLPDNKELVAIILETKASKINIENYIDEIKKNCSIALKKYNKVIGIIYNGENIKVFKNNEEIKTVSELQNKEYYLSLFSQNKIDKQFIYSLTKKINDSLHIEFGIKNLYHRMIFTASALVAKRYNASLYKGMNYQTFHTSIHSTLGKSLADSRKQNQKLDLLLEVYSEIRMNSTENQEAIDNFIECVEKISDCINSDFWNGEDVMGIFFNEFNRYKKKSESGQVFTPDHITSLMYRLIEVNKDDIVFDGACGSGAFLVKSMCNMINEAGGINTDKAKEIKQKQLYGIEFDREIYALACANMLIHKDGKTNLEQLDTRTEKACRWIKYENPEEKNSEKLVERKITKVLMNPPFETKYGCMNIVKNVLDSVPKNIKCAFILPDKKLEKSSKTLVKNILQHHTLKKIIKLPEKVFLEGVTTSIFIFETGVPQNEKEIFTCYIEEDGLETVKNQGRQDIKDRWQEIEDYFIDVINKQTGDKTIKWINPKEHLSYQVPQKPFEIFEEDFTKTMMDYLMYKNNIDVREFSDKLLSKVMYSSDIASKNETITITLGRDKNKDE